MVTKPVMEPSSIPTSEVVATEQRMEPSVLVWRLWLPNKGIEPSVPVSEIVATEQEIEIPIYG